MMARLLIGVFVSAFGAVACESGGSSVSEDERGSVGPASPAAVYCVTRLGYTNTDEHCVFPDGTSCEQWSFYRGTCGQTFSYCTRHGGTLSSREVDVGGGFTNVKAFCKVPGGVECEEEDYSRTGTCP